MKLLNQAVIVHNYYILYIVNTSDISNDMKTVTYKLLSILKDKLLLNFYMILVISCGFGRKFCRKLNYMKILRQNGKQL